MCDIVTLVLKEKRSGLMLWVDEKSFIPITTCQCSNGTVLFILEWILMFLILSHGDVVPL